MSAASFYGQQSGGHGQGGFPQRPAGYQDQPYNSNNNNNQRPNPPEPWFAEWDSQQSTWVYINKQNGQRSHQFPQSGGYNDSRAGGYPQQGGYGQPSGYGQQGGYGAPPPQQQKQSHAGRNTAIAAVGGLAAGALLMHEGHKVGMLSFTNIPEQTTNL